MSSEASYNAIIECIPAIEDVEPPVPQRATSKRRGWCFTLNNPSITESNSLKALGESELEANKATYLVIGRETGESGTPHLQGYIHFKSQRAMSSVKSIIGHRAHLEGANGTPQQNRTYCSKDGDFDEYGDVPTQGERTDLSTLVKRVIRDNWELGDELDKPIGDMDYELLATGLKNKKFIDELRNLRAKKKRRRYDPEDTIGMDVIWCWGGPGSGKSKWAYENYADEAFTYPGSPGSIWFDNYNYEPTLIVDDLRGTKRVGAEGDQTPTFPFAFLLRLLDRYEMQVPVKGSFMHVCLKRVVITCPFPPEEAYQTTENIQQLLRRITTIKHFEGGLEDRPVQPNLVL